jgi:hypothetical protein
MLTKAVAVVKGWFLLLALSLVTGCATIVGSVTGGLAENLSAAILNSDDPPMVRDGAPSYLILIDSLLAGNPDSATLLSQSAELHSAYAGAFVAEPERAQKLHA